MFNCAITDFLLGLKWKDLKSQIQESQQIPKGEINEVHTSTHPREAAEHCRQRENSVKENSRTVNKSPVVMTHN